MQRGFMIQRTEEKREGAGTLSLPRFPENKSLGSYRDFRESGSRMEKSVTSRIEPIYYIYTS